ncbi:MAG: hypothetical protein WKF84_15010 [Pyrinomonadaceae bacterium]
MQQSQRFKEIIATYRKFNWKLKRVLLSAQSAAELGSSPREALFGDAEVRELMPVDALWFARPSPPAREAWELRLVGASQFALFETFESDESEEEREELRRELESQLFERVTSGLPQFEIEDAGGQEDD